MVKVNYIEVPMINMREKLNTCDNIWYKDIRESKNKAKIAQSLEAMFK